MTDSTLSFHDSALANQLFGPQNLHLKKLSEVAGVTIVSRGAQVTLEGTEEAKARVTGLLSLVYETLEAKGTLHPDDLAHAYRLLLNNPATDLKGLFQTSAFVVSPRKTIPPKTLNQRAYIKALTTSALTFAVGPAGTGKTYVAVAVALSMLTAKKVKRLILTRPAVEAGEKLGFLPGDMAQKVNPYLRPLFDALHDMLDYERVNEMIETGIIEIAPLAFMRGRTLNDAFIILDEAQNTTTEQMKMFVTRMGFGSYMAIAGDVTQIDLPEQSGKSRSGLVHALQVLRNMEGIEIIHFQDQDVIRHPLVGRIVHAYDIFKTHSR